MIFLVECQLVGEKEWFWSRNYSAEQITPVDSRVYPDNPKKASRNSSNPAWLVTPHRTITEAVITRTGTGTVGAYSSATGVPITWDKKQENKSEENI